MNLHQESPEFGAKPSTAECKSLCKGWGSRGGQMLPCRVTQAEPSDEFTEGDRNLEERGVSENDPVARPGKV